MKIAVLTGAGISAESGIPTFRGQDGLWKNFRAEELATPEAFNKNPSLVWEWYDWRRQLVAKAQPNEAHLFLAKMEKRLEGLWIITQNVDGLHQRAGSKRVIELHGSLWKLRCVSCKMEVNDHSVPLKSLPPRCQSCGGLMRPGVVWFGESLPESAIREAVRISEEADVFLVVGTSAVVYPAAELPLIAKRRGAKVIEVNPEETGITPYVDLSIRKRASEGVKEAFEVLYTI